MEDFEYMPGFGNEFESESLPNSLPDAQNNPQVAPYGLYAEQLTGSAFTMPRGKNFRSWLYRIRPSVCHTPFEPYDQEKWISNFSDQLAMPHQFRWSPPEIPRDSTVDFIDGIVTYSGVGAPELKTGLAIHYYLANTSMINKGIQNSDGDMLIVPQHGTLTIQTEMGFMRVAPHEICVIQRGIQFSVSLDDGEARGYILEVFLDVQLEDSCLFSYQQK